jgi:hypothetical protein
MRALLFWLLLSLPAAAGGLSDLLMAPGLFAGAADGPVLAYAYEREVPDGAEVAPVSDSRLDVTLVPGPEDHLFLSREEGGGTLPLAEFPADSPNPALLFFLESTVRSMAGLTGGSPFYIRNRIREAVAAADVGPAAAPSEVMLHPFAGDPNRARMGAHADLTLRLRFDPDRPDRILELSADTAGSGGGYNESMVLLED